VNDISPDFQISLFPDLKVNVLIEKLIIEENRKIFLGKTEGDENSEVIIRLNENDIQAFITSDRKVYEITNIGQFHSIKQIDPGFYNREEQFENIEYPNENSFTGVSNTNSFESESIDVAVVYTNAVAEYWGGEANLVGLLELNISQMNLGFQNSGIVHQVNLVGTKLVNYDEASLSVAIEGDTHSYMQEWDNVSLRVRAGYAYPDLPGSGYFEDAREFRNTTGADLLVVVAKLPNIYCGKAGLLQPDNALAFDLWTSLINSECVGAGSLTIAHEIGHNLGCYHDRANWDGWHGYFEYSNGYWVLDEFRTIMAYPNYCGSCVRINHWSNPDINYNDVPTGVDVGLPLSANNAATINATAPIVSGFRQIKAPHLLSPSNYETVNSTPIFGWEQVTDATSYILEVFQSGDRVLEKELRSSEYCNGSTCSYSLITSESLSSGSFSWKIWSKNDLGRAPSTTWVLIVPGVPAKPMIIEPGGDTTKTILTYVWYALPEADDYLLHLIDPNGNSKYYGWHSKSELGCESGKAACKWVSSEALVQEGEYIWQVKARNGSGEGEYSTTLPIYFKIPKPGTPAKISPIDRAIVGINPTFSWSNVDSATQYRLIIEQSQEDILSKEIPTSEICNAEICSYTLGDLESLSSGSHMWWVVAGNSTGYSEGENGWWIIVEGIPSKPVTFSPGNPYSPTYIDNVQPVFKWYPLIEASLYHLTLKNNSGVIVFQEDVTSSTAVCGRTCSFTIPAPLLQNGVYEWVLSGENSYGAGLASIPLFFNLVSYLNPPGDFKHTAPVNDSTEVSNNPTLSWESSSGANAYEFCYDTTDDDTCSSWTSNGTSTSKALSGLSYNTTYYWHVRAVNSTSTTYSDSSSTAFWSFTTQVEPPAVFGKIGPVNGATSVSTFSSISWGSSANANSSYEYCFDTSNDNTCSSWISNGYSTSKALSGLNYNTTYYWHVRAVHSTNTTYSDGSSTAFWSFTTQVAPPAAFGKISPNDDATLHNSSLSLSWESTANAVSYAYCIDTSDDDACLGWLDNGSLTNVVLSDLSPNTEYFWQVRAVNPTDIVYADDGSWWAFIVTEISPAYDEELTTSKVNFNWSDVPDATSYKINLSTDPTFATKILNLKVFSSAYAYDAFLAPSTTYYWRVRPIYADYKGAWSAVYRFESMDPLTAPLLTLPVHKNNVSSPVTLTWDSVNNAVNYKLLVATDTLFLNRVVNVKINETSKDVTLPTGKYYWRVRAIDASGSKSPWSEVRIFKVTSTP